MSEDSLSKRGRLRQTAGERYYTRWRKFEPCSGLEDGASQNWWQERRTHTDREIEKYIWLIICDIVVSPVARTIR